MFTFEIPELFHITRLSDNSISHLADNVVLLQYVERGPEMRRSLTIIKSRGSTVSHVTREFKISSDGITLGEPVLHS